MSSAASPRSLALSLLLEHTADALAAVRAGRSLTEVLAACPVQARPGTQALAFHVLRWLGGAQAVRALLAPKAPPPPVDALLTSALALLWPVPQPPYADHTLVDQAVEGYELACSIPIRVSVKRTAHALVYRKP